jgi:hypothetical protein
LEDNSILKTTAEAVGFSEDYIEDDDPFKNEIITAINSHLNKLNQIGIGVEGYHIESADDEWDAFYGDVVPANKQWLVREYLKLAVKKSVDPPTSSILQSQLKEQMDEIEFRLLVDQPD